MQYSKSRDL